MVSNISSTKKRELVQSVIEVRRISAVPGKGQIEGFVNQTYPGRHRSCRGSRQGLCAESILPPCWPSWSTCFFLIWAGTEPGMLPVQSYSWDKDRNHIKPIVCFNLLSHLNISILFDLLKYIFAIKSSLHDMKPTLWLFCSNYILLLYNQYANNTVVWNMTSYKWMNISRQ